MLIIFSRTALRHDSAGLDKDDSHRRQPNLIPAYQISAHKMEGYTTLPSFLASRHVTRAKTPRFIFMACIYYDFISPSTLQSIRSLCITSDGCSSVSAVEWAPGIRWSICSRTCFL